MFFIDRLHYKITIENELWAIYFYFTFRLVFYKKMASASGNLHIIACKNLSL